MTDRPDWNQYGLQMAFAAAARADCTRRKVGAVLMLSDNSIAVTGYNGGHSGGPSCLKGECPRGQLTHEQLAADSDYSSGVGTCVALHAEWNVLIRASWEQQLGASLFVTCEPCHLCWTLIKGSRIGQVVWSVDGTPENWLFWDRGEYMDLFIRKLRGYVPGRYLGEDAEREINNIKWREQQEVLTRG